MQFDGMKQKLSKMTDAVQDAGNTCMIIVAGHLAGIGSDCLDKFFRTEESGSKPPKKGKVKTERNHDSEKDARPKPTMVKADKHAALKEDKAHELQEKLSSHVSTPNELII